MTGTDTQERAPLAAGDGCDADAVVLGAGVSGLVSASVLLQQGAGRVLVLDGYEQVGGNHLDAHVHTEDGDDYTFDVGSLIFQDDSPLLAHFPELLPLYTPVTPGWSRVNPQGRVAAYPFSLSADVLSAGPLGMAGLLGSAAAARLRRHPQRNARDFAEHWLGRRFVARSGLASYMERLCGVPPEEIDLEFTRRRMMWIPKNASLPNLLHRATARVRRVSSAPTNTQLVRPFAGFRALYTPAVTSLRARGADVVTGAQLQGIRRLEGPDDAVRFEVRAGGSTYTCSRLISTVPLDVALDLSGLRDAAPPLPAVTLTSLYYSFSGERGFTDPVLYNFSHEGTWKRLTMHSDFYGTAPSGRSYFGVEVVATRAPQSVPEAAEAFRRHTSAVGLFAGDLRLEGSHVLEHAYPVYSRGSGDHARAAIAALRQLGVESLGRQGAFQYQPTARHSTLEAEAALGAVPAT